MGVYFSVLWRRKWIVLVTTIFTVAVVTISNFRSEPIYTATSKVRVVPFGIGQPDYGTFLYFEQLTNTLSDILTSRSVVDEAKEQLDLDGLPEYEISVIPNSELLQITVTASDPELTQRTANVLTTILIERVRSFYSTSFTSIEESLRGQLADLEQEINELILEQSRLRSRSPINTVRIAEIERTLQLRQETYSNLSISYNQALVAQAEQANLISVIEPASAPLTPSNRGLPFWAGIGAVIGLLGGIVLAFFLEIMQPRFYSDKQLEAVSGKRPLGQVPKIGRKQRNHVFEKDLLAAEMIRRLRDNVTARMETSSHKSLLIASVQPNIDNTAVSYNLAVSLALIGRHVLLVDADMRQPKLHQMVNIANVVGLSEVLHSRTAVDKVIRAADVEGLDILTAGSRALDSAEILNLPLTCDLVKGLQKKYDFIVFNGPPFTVVTDSLILARIAGNTVLTVGAESLRQDVAATVENLNQIDTNFLGIVVTGVRRSAVRVGRPY